MLPYPHICKQTHRTTNAKYQREREKTKRKRKSRFILTIWRTPGIPGCLSWGLYLARMFRNPIALARSGPARIGGSKGNDCPPFFKAGVRRPWEDWVIGGGGFEVSEAGGRSGWGRRRAVAPHTPARDLGRTPTQFTLGVGKGRNETRGDLALVRPCECWTVYKPPLQLALIIVDWTESCSKLDFIGFYKQISLITHAMWGYDLIR